MKNQLTYFGKIAISLGMLLFSISQSGKAQDEFILQSPNIPVDDTVWVFMPSDYQQSQKEYPAAYLLHGYAGNYHQWNDITDLQTLADRFGFILISPDAFFDSWYLNSPNVENSQYADFFFEDLTPEIEKRYRINPEEVFVTGLSMGGHGAMYLFSLKSDEFKSAGSISGVVNLKGTGQKYSLQKHLGDIEAHSDNWIKHSVVGNLDTIAAAEKKIIFSCGWDDPFYKMNQNLISKADSLGMDATFISHPGGHNYEYWNKALPQHLFFFKNQLE